MINKKELDVTKKVDPTSTTQDSQLRFLKGHKRDRIYITGIISKVRVTSDCPLTDSEMRQQVKEDLFYEIYGDIIKRLQEILHKSRKLECKASNQGYNIITQDIEKLIQKINQ